MIELHARWWEDQATINAGPMAGSRDMKRVRVVSRLPGSSPTSVLTLVETPLVYAVSSLDLGTFSILLRLGPTMRTLGGNARFLAQAFLVPTPILTLIFAILLGILGIVPPPSPIMLVPRR